MLQAKASQTAASVPPRRRPCAKSEGGVTPMEQIIVLRLAVALHQSSSLCSNCHLQTTAILGADSRQLEAARLYEQLPWGITQVLTLARRALRGSGPGVSREQLVAACWCEQPRQLGLTIQTLADHKFLDNADTCTMPFIRQVQRSATVAFSPTTPCLATGSVSGAVDSSFSTDSTLQASGLALQLCRRTLCPLHSYVDELKARCDCRYDMHGLQQSLFE